MKLRGSTAYGSDAKVQPELILVDKERLDWLEENPDRLEDVRGRVNNENVTVRAAIDWFIRKESE